MRGLLLVVVLSVMGKEVYGTDCHVPPYTNGCSIPLNISFWYQQSFAPACNRHDICYGCGDSHNISRDACDRTFRQDMESICNTMEHGTFFGYYVCKGFAYVYYYAVDSHGDSGFYSFTRSASLCHETRVLDCLPL